MGTKLMDESSRQPSPGRLGWLTALAGWLIVTSVGAQTFEVVHAFRNWGDAGTREVAGHSRLVVAPDGNLYGTAYWGGTNSAGSVIRVDQAGVVSTVHSFGYADGANPAAGLICCSDGYFYGTTAYGGAHTLGTVFRMNLAGVVSVLHSFAGADGAHPLAALVQAKDGKFYGTTADGGAAGDGTVFRMGGNGQLETLHSFDRHSEGARPFAELLEADGSFYGTTSQGGEGNFGTLFRVSPDGSLSTIHQFQGTDGQQPVAGLIQAASGYLYGTTSFGGDLGGGTVFRVELPDNVTVLRAFASYADTWMPVAPLIQGFDGYLYGTTSQGSSAAGTLFRLSESGEFIVIHGFLPPDGATPQVGLVQTTEGEMYGMTELGSGTVFRLNLDGSVTTLHHFELTDAFDPVGPLAADPGGNIYGTTMFGGSDREGTVFRIDTTGALALLHSFNGMDGSEPGGLIRGTDGNLYGTAGGGSESSGTIYAMFTTGVFFKLHDMAFPQYGPSTLLHASDGWLYGTSWGGGSHNAGAVFRIYPFQSWTFENLCSFGGQVEGSSPSGPLVEGADGTFYGTTSASSGGTGTVFQMSPDHELTTLHEFESDPGIEPHGGVIYADGLLFGTTFQGCDQGAGTAFRLAANGGDFETIHCFDYSSEGGLPLAPLLRTAVGQIFGLTSFGYSGRGALFRIDGAGGVTVLHTFDGWSGLYPQTGLIEAPDGALYGASGGGPYDAGVIYRLRDAIVAVNETTPFSGPAAGGTALDIIGGGFTAATSVTIGGVLGTDLVVPSSVFGYLFTPPLPPGTLNDIVVTVPPGDGAATAIRPKAFFADFLDVPQDDLFHEYVEKIFRAGITVGCLPGSYCPSASVTRAQMAVFLLKSKHGSDFVPPACSGIFSDVPCPSLFADWIEELAAEGIAAGCGSGNYCPGGPVTRAHMSAFLLKAKHGSSYVPPPCTGVFADVSCPSVFGPWIEELAAEQITGGCGGGNYCPGNPNTRAQMAVFLVKTFGM